MSSVDDPAARLARKVARKIASLLDLNNGEWVEGENGPRAIAPGDILILVRKRDAFFEAMIRALKEQHIPVAGADRLDLMNHIAVMDLCALGRAALLPEDDLTLAIVLKSPLVGLGDDDLIALAPKREGALIHALEQSKAPAPPGGGAATERLEPRRAAIDALRFLQPRARRRTGTRTARRAAGAGGERRHRRIFAPRSRFRARRTGLADELSRRRRETRCVDQARHGSRRRRGARDDRPCREGS